MSETRILSVEAIENIQQLKENIKALKAEIETLTIGSDKYNEKVVELAENQRALKLAQTGTYQSMKDVAAASKLDTDAINSTVQAAKQGTATYYEMSAALGELKKEVKSVPKYLSEQAQAMGEINPQYSALNEQIKVLDGSLKSLDADNGVFSRNVGNYLGALQEWGGIMGQVQQVGSQLMSGMMSLVGVMSILGIDTDKTKNALQAMAPVVALLNTAKGIGGLTKLLPKASAGQKDLANATKKATVETRAEVGATNQLTTAEAGATAAGITLKAVLNSLGIGLIVSAVGALVTAVYGLITGTAKADAAAKDFEETQTKLNEAFEDAKDELEDENKLLEAQGADANVLIGRKITLIEQYIEEKRSILEANEARLDEIEQHNWLQKLFKGEFGLRKKLIEQNKTLTAEIKEQNKAVKSLQTEQRVNDIKKAQKAAEELAKTYEKNVADGLSTAQNAIKNARTELAGINLDFEEERKKINDAIDATEKLIKTNRKAYSNTKDAKKRNELEEKYVELLNKKDTLQKGLIASENNRTETLNAYYSREYESEVLRLTRERTYDIEKNTKALTEYEKIMRNVLGYSESEIRASKEATQETQNLLAVYEKIGTITEQTIRSITELPENVDLSNLTVSGLDWETMIRLSETDAERLAKNVGEPLATAIGLYVKNSNNIRETTLKSAEEIVASFNDGLNKAMGSNNYWLADAYFNQVKSRLTELFGNDETIFPTIQQWFKKIDDELTLMLVNDPIGQALKEKAAGRGSFLDNLFGNIDEIKVYFGTKKEELKAEISLLQKELINAFLNGDDEKSRLSIVKLIFGKENELAEVGRQELDSFKQLTSDFLDDYVTTTTDAIDSILNVWETAIKKRYYDQVKYGQLTEEEAEEQAKKEFEVVKAVQLGLTVVNTAAAIMSALATSGNWYAGVANAITAAAEGIAQFMTIQMTAFSKPSVDAPNTSLSTPSYTSEPAQTVYAYAINPMDYAEAQAQTPIKAYVVDQDLAEGLNNYNNRNEETTF